MVKLLVEKGGADVQERNATTGWVALHEASFRGHIECVKVGRIPSQEKFTSENIRTPYYNLVPKHSPVCAIIVGITFKPHENVWRRPWPRRLNLATPLMGTPPNLSVPS